MALLIPAAAVVDPQTLWRAFAALNQEDEVLKVALIFAVLAGIVYRFVPEDRETVRGALRLFALAVVLLVSGVLFEAATLPKAAQVAHWFGLAIGGIALVALLSLFLFDVVFRLSRLHVPRILRDLLVGIAYFAVLLTLLSRAGVGITQLLTTSAIVTAVIGLSMQDTLGNFMAGMALQLENTISVGDWIKIDQTVGRVTEIRWRHTTIETRNWDTVIVPNSQLIKTQVTVLGRRTAKPLQHRQWLYFNVDFRFSPTQVIHAVTDALTAEPIENVSSEPKPNCLLYDIKESFCYYAVRYWLTDLAVDDPTDSRMRTLVYFALQRAGIPMSIPAARLFMSEHSEAHIERDRQRDTEQRMAALATVELFDTLSIEERRKLAERLHFAPFTAGEVVTRQGAEAHWLYLLILGSVKIVVTKDGAEEQVSELRAPDFFGEMSLMTGAPRSATVIALEDTHCYRLDKSGFKDILHDRPAIAEHISQVIAQRMVGLEASRTHVAAEARERRLRELQSDILSRILHFFGIERGAAKAGHT